MKSTRFDPKRSSFLRARARPKKRAFPVRLSGASARTRRSSVSVLVPKTDTEDRRVRAEAPDSRTGNARFFGRARARRNDDLFGSKRVDFIQRNPIVAKNLHAGAELA